ncbi:transposase [Glutamicibacter sp. JL.03c]|uniref:transposase n=1 Tax=Glutamicibacter sp. JL.03c TaxID=2984842 RepID=UPI0021F7C9B8|nr:transposase [Glutamicibacter sp. JL.03c]UYQ78206.1 transposase [Glutamicibacter sp. JL.03c]
MPIKCTDELKTRAVDLVIHALADPSTANGAISRVAKELGLSSETLRTWVRNYKNSGAMTLAQSIVLEADKRLFKVSVAQDAQQGRSPAVYNSICET